MRSKGFANLGPIVPWLLRVDRLEHFPARQVRRGEGHLIEGSEEDAARSIWEWPFRRAQAELIVGGQVLEAVVSLQGGFGVSPFVIVEPYPLPELDFQGAIAEGRLYFCLPAWRFEELARNAPKPVPILTSKASCWPPFWRNRKSGTTARGLRRWERRGLVPPARPG